MARFTSRNLSAGTRNVTKRESIFVFPGPDGKQKRTFRDPWYNMRKRAGIPESVRFHGLRHKYASYLASNGGDLLTIGELLSHKDIETTKRYAHLADSHLRKTAALSGELLAKKAKDNVIEIKK
jgi:site-specific recombinase XerD